MLPTYINDCNDSYIPNERNLTIMENLKNTETVNLEAVDIPRPICPIMSIDADDYTPCVGERCQLWKYQRCGLFHESPDLYDIVEAVNDLTDAVEHMDKTIDRLQL